jgi:hypothetical protein
MDIKYILVWIISWLPLVDGGAISTIGSVRHTNSPSVGLTAITVYGNDFGTFDRSHHHGRHAGKHVVAPARHCKRLSSASERALQSPEKHSIMWWALI